MAASVNFTEDALFTCLRKFIISLLPATVPVIKAQVNRVPTPKSEDFVIINLVGRERLATNIDTYKDNFPNGPGVLSALAKTKITFQVDVHGPASGENVQIITTLFRDYVGCDWFNSDPTVDAMPLDHTDPQQLPFITAEHQYDTRWQVDLAIQANLVVTNDQQFFDKVDVGLISVDATYPP